VTNPHRDETNPRRERARELFPQVLLAVLGVIQALALELVWSKGVGGLDAWRAAGAYVAGVLQIVAILLGVVVVWAMYANLVMRFSWMPRFRDLLTPFAIGISEFLVVEWMTPDRLPAWFVGMALLFAISMGTNFETFRGAILPADDVKRVGSLREQLGSYVPGGVALVALLACALLAHAFGPASWVSVVALLAASGGLAAQLLVMRRFWREDLAETD
jgi:hypothetical protein